MGASESKNEREPVVTSYDIADWPQQPVPECQFPNATLVLTNKSKLSAMPGIHKISPNYSKVVCDASCHTALSIDDNFLGQCDSVKVVHLHFLIDIASIGNDFLHGCHALTTILFRNKTENSCVSVTVGNNFMRECYNLTAVDFSPLRIRAIGDNFLWKCAGLKKITLGQECTTVGSGFLGGCSGLKKVDLRPLREATVVKKNFLCGCSGLESVDLSPLKGIKSVGDNFLFCCSSLTAIDLSPLDSVTEVGSKFLWKCAQLQTVDLIPLTNVTSTGKHFLSHCTSLKTITLPPTAIGPTIHITETVLRQSKNVALNAKQANGDVISSLKATPQKQMVEVALQTDLGVVPTTQTELLEVATQTDVKTFALFSRKRLSWVKCLGSGGQGTVSLFQDKTTHDFVAVKTIDFSSSTDELKKEYDKLVKLKYHPNIVHVHQYVENATLQGFADKRDCIIMEYAALGSIANLVIRRQHKTVVCSPFEQWLDVALQTLCGLKALHLHGLQHNDLKPENVLMHSVDGEMIYKLADLGFGEEFDETNSTNVIENCPGTLGYRSPESVEERQYSRKSDVYSWACTMGYIATGKVPRAYQKGHPEVPRGYTARELMEDGTPLPVNVAEKLVQCFSFVKDERPTVTELTELLGKEKKRE